MSGYFSGDVAIVTGGSRGIGREIATALAERGASVVVNYHTGAAAAEAVVGKIEAAGGEAIAVRADVSEPDAVTAMIDETVTTFGSVDVCVNNAGITEIDPATELALEDWRRVIEVDLTGVFVVARAVGQRMRASDGGAIVNVASIMGEQGYAMRAPYTAAKAGVINLTRTLAVEWAPDDIVVNALAPGFVRTDITDQSQSAAGYTDTDVRRRTPMARYGTVAEMANCVAFLARRDTYVTGETLHADGGWTADAWQYDEHRA